MKCNSIKPIGNIKPLTALTKEKIKRSNYLSKMEMILYSTNLCYYSTRIIRNEIEVNNRNFILDELSKEVYRMHKLLNKQEFDNLENVMTKKEYKDNFKRFGITEKRLEH